ncbi:lactonase family protein [Rubinisphaera brasiliensis]|uniref:6-phosphogluconolactonase n=1 Tax=Rubinisphaera brasiliensis (strain ATCC 49424 / DSM 5305 / JCM 21570 / IAM 15109 / NBRC 103401 / IFAM 1448) TaxID=756272 RepID=F0SPA2_RUBBR|nr:lactonase family protein [Rubinisphaera brasiliensis]ADY62210.1 6-phosphogluconolactonase [Rubinisphaera brasiliensis DSM 5305]
MFRLLVSLTVTALMASASAQAEQQRLFIASAGKPSSIETCTFDSETGQFGEVTTAVADVQTGFMALHPKLPILYAAVSEKVPRGQMNGAVYAYRIDAETGELKQLGSVSTGDMGNTHIEVAANGQFLAVCHYGGVGTTLVPLMPDGSLSRKISRQKHAGSSAHPQRQTRPHPHGVAISRNSKFVLVADLGNDHVEVFPVSAEGKLTRGSYWQAAAGAGPRHVSFHPNGRWLYSINELDSTVSVLEFDDEQGQLKELQTVDTLPEDFDGENTTAEVVVHPSGKFLFGSNRGHNSNAVFQIDEQTGRLSFVEREPTQGDHPRFVGQDPTGSMLISANRNDDELVAFSIDQNSGELKPTGNEVNVARPMCVLFVPID